MPHLCNMFRYSTKTCIYYALYVYIVYATQSIHLSFTRPLLHRCLFVDEAQSKCDGRRRDTELKKKMNKTNQEQRRWITRYLRDCSKLMVDTLIGRYLMPEQTVINFQFIIIVMYIVYTRQFLVTLWQIFLATLCEQMN